MNASSHGKKTRILLGLALAAALSSAAHAGEGALTEAQVKATLEAQGYSRINDVKFKDGVWKADARSADGNRVDVRLDPKTGQVFPDEQVANLTEADVKAKLSAQGYTDIEDVRFRNGLWNAKADNRAGVEMALRIDPATGEVIGQDKD
ncbi:MAG: PepSY domain-containing protein [Lysobacter sp.]|nr:PepSY domain-containing protein [Lysobacter sp.]